MASASSQPQAPAAPPRGRDEVKIAILEAAADLMAQRGSAASLRDIASAAGVNLGLIHRHFGNKSDLRRAVLMHLGTELRTRLERANGSGSLRSLFNAVATDDRALRIQILALLGDEPVADVQDQFPVMNRLVEMALEAAGPDADPAEVRFRVGRGIATGIGWLILEPFLREAVGIEGDGEALRDRMAADVAQEFGLPE